jgi:hypothetical protein
VLALNIYPKLAVRGLEMLKCCASPEAIKNAILQRRADDPENAGAEAGLPIAMICSFDEFEKEIQYTEILFRTPLIALEKIGHSDPVPFKQGGKSPLDGIRAFFVNRRANFARRLTPCEETLVLFRRSLPIPASLS